MKKRKQLIAKMQKTHKAINSFISKTMKNYATMKATIKKIWLLSLIITTACACNVTRVITNQSEYFQKGDTAVTIQTKTIETYNAERK